MASAAPFTPAKAPQAGAAVETPASVRSFASVQSVNTLAESCPDSIAHWVQHCHPSLVVVESPPADTVTHPTPVSAHQLLGATNSLAADGIVTSDVAAMATSMSTQELLSHAPTVMAVAHTMYE